MKIPRERVVPTSCEGGRHQDDVLESGEGEVTDVETTLGCDGEGQRVSLEEQRTAPVRKLWLKGGPVWTHADGVRVLPEVVWTVWSKVNKRKPGAESRDSRTAVGTARETH